MRRVIIDTDPGTDDTLALMMALNCPDLMVEGITTVGGNATLSETTENALRLMEYLDGPGSAMPVAVGSRPIRRRASTPMPTTFTARRDSASAYPPRR